MNNEFLNELRKKTGTGFIFEMEPMKQHTTFRVGGPADVLVTPSAEALPEIVALCE